MEEDAPRSLNAELIAEIYREAVMGKDATTVPGEEAAAYFKKIKVQVDEMRKDPNLTEFIIPSDPFTDGPSAPPSSQEGRDRAMHRTMGWYGSAGFQIVIDRSHPGPTKLTAIQRREVKKLAPEDIERIKKNIAKSFQHYFGSIVVELIPFSEDLPPRE